MDLASQVAGIGALAEPVRRALYEYVAGQPEAVGREQAADAVGVPMHTAKFHLDKLVDEGLLDVEFRRLTGRSGPGAGRPAKLYRRSAAEWTVSLPARRYHLAGHILATALETAARDGLSVPDSLHAAAHTEGELIGAATKSTGDELERVSTILKDQGYEARLDDDTVVLANCPFDALAKEHTELVCGLNQSFVQGVADGLGCQSVVALLEPEPGHCCVKTRRSL
ncbi:MAG: putative transcriptional regulator [Marmoricola sp.]|jgi:predicted ArsR family transcriptional regulator|nr:putative transcriptional regulator [Marmoricola sp.]